MVDSIDTVDRENLLEEMQDTEEERKGKKILGTLKNKYLSVLLKLSGQSVKVKIPSKISSGSTEKVTKIKKIADPDVEEVEMDPVEEPYSYVRIKYDNQAGEYLYEVIEPQLSEDESNLLEVLKDALVMSLNLAEDASDEEKAEILEEGMEILLKKFGVSLHPISKDRILYYLRRDFIGYGAIQVLMIDPNVEDASCNGVGIPMYIYHRKYGSIRSNIVFDVEEELDSFVVWLAQKSGKHISVADPLLDATTPDGSRLNATLGKHVTKRGSSFTIRRFRGNPFTPVDLLKFRTLSTDMMAYLWIATEYGSSMLVCGGTASGKTTTLNAVLLFIPPQMKIVSIEDTRELNLPHENWIPGLTREGFGGRRRGSDEGGTITMYDLLTAALRQRPQYLMVGEVRGKEAYVVFQAMATGKTAYSTFHAEDVSAMVHRMENDPINLPRALMTALDIVLLQAQVKVGTKMTRRVKSLTEIVGMDPETGELITNSTYSWSPADDTFNFSGHSYVFEKVRTIRNWSPREMEREVKRRVDILEYMKKIGVDNYKQVANIVSAYYKDPDSVMKKVKEELSK